MSKEHTVWVLWWRFHDGSGDGVTRVYESSARAEADLAMLREHANVDYRVTEVPMMRGFM